MCDLLKFLMDDLGRPAVVQMLRWTSNPVSSGDEAATRGPVIRAILLVIRLAVKH